MDNTTRSRLHDMTLRARHLLSEEIGDLLEGVYGLDRQGRFSAFATLPAVQTIDEVRETRARLESYLHDEASAGLAGAGAVEKLVKEVAFTHLNRLVAFKMLESCRAIRGTIDKYQESNAFKLYVARVAEDRERYEAGTLPQDALGEGPRDTAYRHFLLAQCAEQAQQIRMLFDPDNLTSHVFPRPRALRDLIEMLNSPDLAPAWAPGGEEAVGWVYQYFNEEEKAEVFARLNKGAKIKVDEIPAATQLFTPHWIVRALVHNTLGRLWMQMHPDSALAAKLDYLVPPAAPLPAEPLRPVREITLLDPACGTMHFGLVAFDLFAAMYEEEIARAGEPGWPAAPSVADQSLIAAAIVANNIHGIDIDLRAVQLSALTMLIKARSLNRDARLTDHNLACADVLLLNGPRLNAFLAETGFTRPIYDRLVRGLWARLKDANQLGSLLRLETDLQDLIAAERAKFAQEQLQPHIPGFDAEQFESEAGEQEFWDIMQARIVQAFDEFARRHAAVGRDESYFVGEASKGLRVLGLMLQKYDVVVANPPYMSNRNMSPAISDNLKKHYPAAKGDLYAAFIQRCIEMLETGGRLGMITQQSFMFLSSYEALRAKLRDKVVIETMIHLGPRAFAEIGGEKVNTTAFVLREAADAMQRANSVGTYLRLIREPDAQAKQLGFLEAVSRLQAGHRCLATYYYRQGNFDAIAGAPWVYWITPGLLSLFRILPVLGDATPPRVGLQTGDNFHFLRYWWEIGIENISSHSMNVQEAQVSGKKWFPYMKGGGFRRWWGNQEYVVNWLNDAQELRSYAPASVVRNPSFYFRKGVTWSDLTAGRFNARLSPGGFIFDVKGSSAFPHDIPLVLGLLNSSFAHYALSLLNPTVSFQVGDIARLPVPSQSSELLRTLVDEAIALAKADSAEDETTYDFVAPPAWVGGLEAVAGREERLRQVEGEIDEEVYRLYGIGPEDRAAIESELGTSDELRVTSDEETGAEGANEGEDAATPAGRLTREELGRRWVSYAVGVALGRFEVGDEGVLGRGEFAPEVVRALGGLRDEDGLFVLDPGHPDDLAARVERVLETIWGEAEAEAILRLATAGRTLPDYLSGDFFKAHLRDYRKRPIYWLLQSPKRKYSLYIFHERITPDTLFLIRGGRYLGGKINSIRGRITELGAMIAAAPGAPKRRLEKELDAAKGLLNDLEAFDVALDAVTGGRNERGAIAGWRPERDDGVLLNVAPLAPIMPGFPVEPRKAWDALSRGEYDWSATALRYWPDRVTEAAQHNKSYAIALAGRL